MRRGTFLPPSVAMGRFVRDGALRASTLALALLAVASAALAADPCQVGPDWTNLKDCPLDEDRGVVIGAAPDCGPNVYVDHTTQAALVTRLGVVTIAPGGLLYFADEPGQNVTLDVEIIDVQGEDGQPGRLQIGAPACPIAQGTVTLTFHGDPSDPPIAIDQGQGRPDGLFTKGIVVEEFGSLVLRGAKGVAAAAGAPSPSWTHLAAPAGPEKGFGAAENVKSPVPPGGSKTLQLASAVDWEAGDWIVVATTDFVPYASEFVRVQSVTLDRTAGTSLVVLDDATPLLNYHFGGPAPSSGTIPGGQPYAGLPASFQDGPERNFGVDERAEVGLISRRVKLTADVPARPAMGDPPAGLHWGGELKVWEGFSRVEIVGVEIEKFGKNDVGRYPVHFHMVGDVSDRAPIVESNSVHHSYNKCFTVHYTDNLTLANNVCARIVDHAFYLESHAGQFDSSPPGCAQLPNREPGSGNTFADNLVVSAMSNGFRAPGDDVVEKARWFNGDYLAVANGYDGFDVPRTSCDDTSNPVAPTSFWITHPGNHFQGNSAAGCQGVGRGFWVLARDTNVNGAPLGDFTDNRAHGCYTGFDTGSDGIGGFENLDPRDGAGRPRFTRIDSFTATRNRNRGIWVRDKYYHLRHPRLATNRDSVSLVSGGGPESSQPGIQSLMTDGVVVGVSQNNPGRFGDCPRDKAGGDNSPRSCAEREGAIGNGYPNHTWNSFGFMFYDGPARLENNRFVNFKVDPTALITTSDRDYLALFPGDPYEGDAAMGWFQSNKNAYPPTQYATGTSWDNVDFRHQVYTEHVNQGDFSDGDKNTVLLDRDGTLSGLRVVGPGCRVESAPCPFLADKYPISLNNLGFNSTPWSIDECAALGKKDVLKEAGRPSALMSPHDVASLELTAPGLLTPVTFTRDTTDFCSDPDDCEHQSMTLTGRNLTSTYEPKVIHQLGYTVSSATGWPGLIGIGLVDAHTAAPLSDTNRFRVRVGLCYATAGTSRAATDKSDFKILRGRHSWGQPSQSTQALEDAGVYQKRGCDNLTNQTPLTRCPSPEGKRTVPAEQEPVSSDALTPVDTLAALDVVGPDGKYPAAYFYDADVGMLYFYLEENAEGRGPSPLADCPADDEACKVQDFYQCPPDGCRYYTIDASATSYVQSAATSCDPYRKGKPYVQEYPTDMNRLAYFVPEGEEGSVGVVNGELVVPEADLSDPRFPHNAPRAGKEPWCPETFAGPLPPERHDCPTAGDAPLLRAATAGVAAGGTAVTAAEEERPCSAFLPRSIGYQATAAAPPGGRETLVVASDWIQTGSFAIRKPTGLFSDEDQGGRPIDPSKVQYLSYSLVAGPGASEPAGRKGIVASDELGTHVLDALGAARLLVPAGVSLDGSRPAVPSPLYDAYKCHRVRRSAGAPRPGDAVLAYTDAAGTHRIRTGGVPELLCVETDVGDGLGNEQTNLACYRARAASGGAGELPLLGGRGGGAIALEAHDRFGVVAVTRRRPSEVCLPVEIVDRGR